MYNAKLHGIGGATAHIISSQHNDCPWTPLASQSRLHHHALENSWFSKERTIIFKYSQDRFSSSVVVFAKLPQKIRFHICFADGPMPKKVQAGKGESRGYEVATQLGDQKCHLSSGCLGTIGSSNHENIKT